MPELTNPNRIIRFTVWGQPQRWKRPEQTRTGRRYSDKDMEAAKAQIAWEAARVWSGPPHIGPVRISGLFIFPIPTGWPKYLKAAAHRGEVDHIIDPDIDQLVKLVMDAVGGIVVVDDNQFSRFGRSAKRYGSPPRSDIVLELLSQSSDAITPAQRRLQKEQVSDGLWR